MDPPYREGADQGPVQGLSRRHPRRAVPKKSCAHCPPGQRGTGRLTLQAFSLLGPLDGKFMLTFTACTWAVGEPVRRRGLHFER